MSEKRYFKTGNANRTYKTAEGPFEFEKLLYQNGTWLGVLELDDGKRAEALKKVGPPVYEIGESEFLELKKKPNSNSHLSEEVVSSMETETTEPEKEGSAPTAVEDLEEELDFKKGPIEPEGPTDLPGVGQPDGPAKTPGE